MAAYAAIVPLKSKIRGYLTYYDACFDPPSLELAQYLYKEVTSFQQFLQGLDSTSRKRMNASLAPVAEASPKFHELLSLHFSEQYSKVEEQRNRTLLRLGLPLKEEEENQSLFPIEDDDHDDDDEGENQLSSPRDLPEGSKGVESNQMSHLIDLSDIEQNIHSFIEALKKVKEEHEEEQSSRIDIHGNKAKMVGLSDLYTVFKEDILRDWGHAVKHFAIVGMAGIGKTTLSKEIFEDLDFVEWYDCRAWVAVGKGGQLQEIVRGIVAQVKPDLMISEEEDDEKISEYLKESLNGKRYLIVLDDVWDGQVWFDLKQLLTATTQNVAGSRVLLTSRIQNIVDRGSLPGLDNFNMRLLSKEESWDLLREKVFAEESCSFKLEKDGRRIAGKCDGLPLTIVMVADLLSKAEKTIEYWNEVATQEKHQVFIAAFDEVKKVLYPSYEYLPQHLKICFLYLGVFPRNSEILASKISNLWIAEGLTLKPNSTKSSKKHAEKCLDKLASSNVVRVHQKSTKSSSDMSIADEKIKVCGLHSSWWNLCQKEATTNNLFHVLNCRGDSSAESITGQSRLCIHNNILLCIREVYESMEENCASTAHSLLFCGPYNRYPVPLCSAFKLLKVLDALNIRFYDFPSQVLELVKLKYLALTYDGELPPSISKLQELQFLIVCPHQNIKSGGANLCLPSEIWDIKELKHLQVTGSDLPDYWGTPLPNIATLLDLSANSCTKGVFKRVYNLSKLGIQIELQPDNTDEPLNCLDHVSILRNLKSLKCVVANPEFRSELVPPPTLSNFPLYLKKLALSGMGYPWSEMSKIASLNNLEVLKLRCNAFQGPKWEIEENTFPFLEYLLIEDSDLEHWKVGCGNFKWLEHLSIKHCYKLQELDWEFDELISMIEVVNCNPVVVKQIKEIMWGKGIPALDFHVHYSWNDGKLK